MIFSGKYCALCHHPRQDANNNNLNDNRKFIQGHQFDDQKTPHIFTICENCAAVFSEAFKSDLEESTEQNCVTKFSHTPRTIKEHLNKFVIGQDDAKTSLAVTVYNHYQRLNNPKINNVEMDKSNVLLIGPTGSGKTLLCKSIARLLDIPFAIVDATSLTEAGYVGDDVETILQRLISSANGDVKKAEKGIIFIDEIDKIAQRNAGASVTRDVSGEGVQQALLKIIEGTISRVPIDEKSKNPKSKVNEIDTKNILFICGGAFVGLDKIIEKKSAPKSMGFSQPDEPEDTLKTREFLANFNNIIEPDDLSKFGLIPEFIGRLPIIVELKELTLAEMRRSITEPENAILKQMQALFSLSNIELEFSDDALDQIIQFTMSRKTGVRGVRAIFEMILKPVMFDLPDLKDVEKILFNNIYDKPEYIYNKSLKSA